MEDQRKIPDLNYTSCRNWTDPMIHVRRAITYQLEKHTMFDFLDLRASNYTLKGVVEFPNNNDNDTENWNDTDKKLPLEYRYWEGPFQYTLFMFSGLVLTLMVVTALMFYIRTVGIKYPCPTMILYKIMMLINSLFILGLVLTILVGQVFFCFCLYEVNEEVVHGIRKELYNLGRTLRDSLFHVYGYVNSINMKFAFLKNTPEGPIMDVVPKGVNYLEFDEDEEDSVDVSGQEKTPIPWSNQKKPTVTFTYHTMKIKARNPLDAMKTEVSTGIGSISDRWSKTAQDVKQYVTENTLDLRTFSAHMIYFMQTQVFGAMKVMRRELYDIMDTIYQLLYPLKYVVFFINVFIIFNILITLFALSIAVCMIRSVRTTQPSVMKSLCRIAYCLMVFWWLISMVYLPISIYLTDMCDRPVSTFVESIAGIQKVYGIPHRVANLSLLLEHYITCHNVNPLAEVVGPFVQALGYVNRGFLNIFSTIIKHGKLYENISNIEIGADALANVTDLQVKMYECIIYGCDRGVILFDGGVKVVCNQCLLGLLIIAITAPFLGIFYMLFVLLSLRIRHFVAGKPPPESRLHKMHRKQRERLANYMKKQRKKQLNQQALLKKRAQRESEEAERIAKKLKKKEDEKAKIKEFKKMKALQQKRINAMMRSDVKTQKHLKTAIKNLPICMCPPPTAAKIKPRYVLKIKCPHECKMIDLDNIEQVRNLNKLHALKSEAERKRDQETEMREDMERPPCKDECKGKRIRGPCIGLDRLRTFMKIGLPIGGKEISMVPKDYKMKLDIADAQGCPGVECPMAVEAFEKLQEADIMAMKEPDRKEHQSVRLKCGCRFPTYKLKHMWGMDE